jgi:hypothetical protein
VSTPTHMIPVRTVFWTMDKGISYLRAYSPGRFAGLILSRPNQAGRGAVLEFARKRLSRLLELDVHGRLVVLSEKRIRVR